MPDPLDSFSVKDMLLSVLAKLDRMDVKLDGKADEQTVLLLEARVGVLERVSQGAEMRASITLPQLQDMAKDLAELKSTAASIKSVETYRHWVIGVTFTTVCGVALTILQAAGVL